MAASGENGKQPALRPAVPGDRRSLSAGVPMSGRGAGHGPVVPYYVQFDIRELAFAALGRRRIVLSWNPAVTAMLMAGCGYLGVDYAGNVTVYKSLYFSDDSTHEDEPPGSVVRVDQVDGDEGRSLGRLRREMLSSHEFSEAVFIGGGGRGRGGPPTARRASPRLPNHRPRGARRRRPGAGPKAWSS